MSTTNGDETAGPPWDKNDETERESGARKKTGQSRAVKDGASDNVYKKLSVINGEINKMSREQLTRRLTEVKLDTGGVNDVLRKRLKSYYRQRKLMRANIRMPSTKPHYDYLLVIDFEATCEANTQDYPHEIIEFPIILVDVHELTVVDEFHSFCKPVLNPILSDFCTELTGITQVDVDAAEEFPAVFQKVEEWMSEKHLGQGNKFAVVTDGPWDVSRFISLQCQHSDMIFPRWAKKWVNIRKTYGSHYQCRRKKLEDMLIYLGMKFEGTQHCGLHDSRNIARIAIRLMEDGCRLKVNDFIHTYPDFKLLKFSNETEELTDSDEDGEISSTKTNGTGEHSCGKAASPSSGVDDVSRALTTIRLESDEESDGVSDLISYYKQQKS